MEQYMEKEKTKSASVKSAGHKGKALFLFGKENYILLIAGIAIILFGYILLSGGGTDNPDTFTREIFSFRRITLAPIVSLIGFGIVMYAIMKKPKE